MEHTEYSSGRINTFFYRVYAWMASALAVTAATAYYVATTPAVYKALVENQYSLFAFFIMQLVFVMLLGVFLTRMNFATAVALFMAYAISVGITLSSIVLVFTGASLFSTFLVTMGMFGGMALYGYATRADLTSWGTMGMMALWGMILGMIVNYFLQSPMMDLVLSGIGVLLFTALTAYDVQKLKQLGTYLLAHQQDMSKAAIMGALTLYLDFLNLFLFLLRFMGKKRND